MSESSYMGGLEKDILIILSFVDCLIFLFKSIDLTKDLASDLRPLDIIIGLMWGAGVDYFLCLCLVVDFRIFCSLETSR